MSVLIKTLENFILIMYPFLIALPFVLFVVFVKALAFKRTEYAKLTKNKYLKTRLDKGLYGEYLIYSYLKDLSRTNRFLFNVYLPKDNGETTEIDVIMISSSGIYVFESKNYSGWIFGKENQKQWTMTLPSGGKSKKFHFLNPIMQNELHIKWLKSILADYEGLPIFSVIAFSNRCTLKNIEYTQRKAEVMKRDAVRAYVVQTMKNAPAVLTEQQVQTFYEKLLLYSQVTEEFKQQHIADIKKETVIPAAVPVEVSAPVVEEPLPLVIETIESEEPMIQKMICSKCGCEMVLRTAKTGENAGKQFWGCSGFPRCRNIINVI